MGAATLIEAATQYRQQARSDAEARITVEQAPLLAKVSVAAANGDADAVNLRNLCAQRLSPTQLAEAQALATRYFEASQPKSG